MKWYLDYGHGGKDFISNIEVENNLKCSKYIKEISDTISTTLLTFLNK